MYPQITAHTGIVTKTAPIEELNELDKVVPKKLVKKGFM